MTTVLDSIPRADEHPLASDAAAKLTEWRGRYAAAEQRVSDILAARAPQSATDKKESRLQALIAGEQPPQKPAADAELQQAYAERRDAKEVVAMLQREAGAAKAQAAAEVAKQIRPQVARLMQQQATAIQTLLAASQALQDIFDELQQSGYACSGHLRNVRVVRDRSEAESLLSEILEYYPEVKIKS